MKEFITKMKGKKVLSLLLAVIMVLSVASPAISPFSIKAEAASTFPVELAFNNIFVFEDWATNNLSSTVIIDGAAQSKDENLLVTDIENGSFTFYKKNMTAVETYTAFSMSETDAAMNSKYYMMPVEPNTKYTFSYNAQGNTWAFTPFVFMYDNQGLFDGFDTMVAYGTPGYGNNSFDFTTPADVTSIQIRFTIGDNTTTPAGNSGASSVYATVKDIAIYKTELKDAYLADQNLFKIEEWKNNPYSNANSSLSPDNGSIVVEDDAIKLTCTSGNFWTGLGIDGEASNKQYYTMAVDPSKSYTLSYDVTNISLPDAVHCQPWIIEMYSDGRCATFYQKDTNLQFGTNKWEFTCKDADTACVQVVFSIAGVTQESSCIVSNIGLYETSVFSVDFETITGHPHRAAYSYTTGSSDNGTYGELPKPSYVPENYVFAGWYTATTNEPITSDTTVSYNSYTVYPKFEPKVDSLEIVTLPSKLTYTVGEKVNTTGLVLKATRTYTVDITNENGVVTGTEQKTDTFNITSGFRFSPESLTNTGTQNITVEYGGKTATYQVTVNASDSKTVLVNGAEVTASVANNNYILDYSATPFNRYELTYYSDSYVKGVITMDADTEVFFLEPSDNGHFASYIDSFLRGIQHYSVISIEFTCLDKEFGKFELNSVTTINAPIPSDPTQYYQNSEYKVGISLDYGGVVSYIEDLDDDVSAAVYNENGQNITKVDYTSKLPSGAIATSNSVNLINTNDRGRYLQQSYYGTDQPPYEMGSYNGLPWSYNPVQGGNINHFDPSTGEVIKGGEASKVIDYRITADQIYIKTRPLDWGKNSEDYPDSYVTDSYMEAWYTFENGMIKTTCRFVDYSGYPSNTTTQEYPALYTIEPLNHFVYNETTDTTAWEAASVAWQTEGMTNIEEPEFWGVLPEYNALLTQNGMPTVDVDVDCHENWAAFTASSDTDSFGIGVYSAGVTDFHYGVFPAIYNEDQVKTGNLVANYRHAASLDPAVESPTSYISPVGTMTFESYKPSTYSFYVTTGTADQIREDFRKVESIESGEALAQTKVAVPETVYMAPADGASTVGEIYVNNILDSNNFYNVTTLAEREDNMYFGIHIADAAYFTVDVSNATTPANDINLCTTGGSAVSTTQQFAFDPNGNFINDGQYDLRFSGTGLNPGEKATAKWDITVTMNDGSTQKYTYYTVMYAPGRTVGAVAEARQVNSSQHEISSWITGANGVDHSNRAPLGSLYGDYKGAGYFTQDPLVYKSAPSGGSGGTATDYIDEVITGVDVDNNVYNENTYVMQTATNDHDSSRAQSYLGLLKVDKSRYTNTNQIPNLEIGYDVLRIGSYVNNSLGKYTTYYTLGTESAYTATSLNATPSGWTIYSGTYTDFANNHSIPYRESFVPSFDVSTIDGKYIHALNHGVADQTINTNQYSTAGTSVLCSVTDKSNLRDSVLTGYGVTDTNPEFDEALKNAATVLGDPSATQEEIDNASKELNDAMQEKVDVYYALKYDNLFSAYEYSQYAKSMTVVADRGTATYSNGTITVVNDTITGGEAYTNYGSGAEYYHVALKPNTEYVFEYDVTTSLNAQAFMFFYNSSGGNSDAPTNMSIKTDNGSWSAKSESSPWWGNYTNGAGSKHYAIKFTTGANTTQAGFRFGNTSNDPVTSTFSNIKLVDSAHYYEDATYSETEELFKEYTSYGVLPTPTRPGYTFSGWVDANGTAVTGANIATEHKSVYSTWNENSYTVNYNKNGSGVVGSADAKQFKYTEKFALPADFSRDYYMFKGWAYSADATAPVFNPGQTISFADIQADKINSNNQVTLYAVWEKGYSLYYSPNNGTGELSGTFAGYTEPHTVKANTSITRTGYTFLGWSLDQNATTPSYYAGDELTVSAIDSKYIQKDANNELQTYVVLHAVWSEHKYGIAFDSNGGTGSMTTMSNIGYDDNATLTANSFTREGYTFNGWNTAANGTGSSYADGASVSMLTADNNANVILYAQWTANSYTIRFNANTGTGNMNDMTLTYDQARSLTANAFTKTDYAFMGWSTTAGGEVVYQNGQSVINLTANNGDVIDLYAVWAQPIVNVAFDNLVDISAWPKTSSKGEVSDVTDTGFTLTSNEGVSEATCSSAFFPVEAGHTYKVQADIKGSGWDVYIFFHNEASTGTGLEFNDGTNRFASNGGVAKTREGITYSAEFTAPAGATKAQLRVDANGSNNVVKFDNIRVHDITQYTTYVNPVNKLVKYSDPYGALPTPVRDGYVFAGWQDQNGNKVTSADVMDSTSTVYLTSTWSQKTNQVFDDTVVIDSGLPVKIDLLSNDGENATSVNAIGKGVSTESLNTTGHTSSKLTGTGTTIELTYGTAKLDGNIVTYTPTKTNFTAEEVFYYEVVIDGNYYYAKVTIIPATSIYYEDTLFTFNNSENNDGKTYEWESLGVSIENHFQTADRPGYNFQNDANDIYGYDTAYDSNVAYSGGTAHYVDVDKASIGFEPTAEFAFTGTGFDLFSVTDNKTGAIRIDVTNASTGKVVARKLVNAYYGYDYADGKYTAVKPSEDYRALFQVPVLSLHNIDYGTYNVKIIPYYSTAFDINQEGNFGVYVDSVRIFDPMGTSNSVANEAYAADGEYAPQYRELRETLVTPIVENGAFTGEYDVTKLGENTTLFLDGGKSTPADFGKIGPNNEIYLASGQAIAFDIETDSTVIPETIQIGMKLTGYNGTDYNEVANSGGDYAHTGTVNLANTNYSGWTETVTLNSATERYYNMEGVLEWKIQDDGTFKTVCPVIITNTSTSNAVISLTSVKWAFGEPDGATTQLTLLSDEQTITFAKAAIARAASGEEQNNPQNTFLAKENIAVSFSGEPYTVGDNGTLVITTEQGVAGVAVNGTDVVSCETTEDGKLQWTYEFTADTAGSVVYEIVARDENGASSETIYASTNVESNEQEETTTPEGDGEADNESDSDSGATLIPGDDLFAYNLVRMLFQFLNKILSMLTGGATV